MRLLFSVRMKFGVPIIEIHVSRSDIALMQYFYNSLGSKISEKEHKADVVRLELLIAHGGIYVDTDVFAFKSIDDLVFNASHSSVMGTFIHSLSLLVVISLINYNIIICRKRRYPRSK